MKTKRKKRKVLIKKNHFFFGISKKKMAKLLFMRRHSNFFFTLVDMNNKVICCKTSGCHDFCLNKKRKVSFQAVGCAMDLLFPFLKLYDIGVIMLIFCELEEDVCYRLIEYLKLNNIAVEGLKFMIKNPHNGVRGKRLRRV
jgi:ribosomal protein S11